ncbi:reverse transcriptase domain-containing protein [Tanacetum coccineum]|uniref:Reverse transcriptase domain-containing protein n=1 Tax=Tanacetum coccineum TaxID=301880 RepID=A0ABQ5F1F4_9ASTR
MVVKKFNLDPNDRLNLSFKLSLLELDITDDEDGKFFVDCASSSTDAIPHMYAGQPKKTKARIIPGPAGIIKAALLRKNADVMEGGHENVMPTQKYVRKIIKDASEDDHFTRGLWLSAVVYLHVEGLTNQDYGTGVLEGGKGVKRKKGRIAEVSGSNAATTIGKNRENMATVEVTASGTGPFSSLSKPFHFLNTTGNSSGGSYDVVNDDPNTGTIPININDSPTLDPNNYGPIHSEPTLYAKVTGEPSRKTISERFANMAYGFFLGKRVAYPVVANYVKNTWGKYGLVKFILNSSIGLFFFQFSSMGGLDSMLENDMWFIRNNSLIMKKWNPNVNLLKKDVGNISVWVKLHGVPVTAFSDDGLSSIATKLGTPLMLDSYTYDMCMQSWGRSSYARAMIELRADVELKDIIVVVMSKVVGGGDEYPKNVGSDVAKNLKSPSQDPKGIPVGPKVGFKLVKLVYIPVFKKNNANTSGKTKKDAESAKEVSYPNLFDVLNSIEIDVDLDTNEGTSNLASKEANSGMWDLVGKPLENIYYSGDHDSEDEVKPDDNEMSSFLASKKVGYGRKIPDNTLQQLPFSPATKPGYPGRLVTGDAFPGRHVARDKLNGKARRGYVPERLTRETTPGPRGFSQAIKCHRRGFSRATCRPG